MNPFNSNSNNGNFDFSILQNNPMFQMLRQRGMSYEDMIRYVCNQKGIDFNQFMQQAQQMYKGNNK